MLHLIFQSPLEQAVLERIVADDVVFLGSAVLNLSKHGRWAETLARLIQHSHLCVLADDLLIRGIAETELAAGLTVVDYAGLVSLTVKNKAIQSWV